MRRFVANKKTITIVGTVLEVEIGPKVNTSGRCRTLVVLKYDPGGGDMKLANINTTSVKLHTQEPLRPDTDGDVEYKSAAVTRTTTEDKNITDPVLI